MLITGTKLSSELSVAEERLLWKEKFVKNNSKDEMKPEYDLRGKQGERGKYRKAMKNACTTIIHRANGSTIVRETRPIYLDDDVQAYFPDAKSVNDALRGLIALVPKKKKLTISSAVMFDWLRKDKNTVISLAESAQKLILELHIRDTDNETFEQEGILNGLLIIKDYVREDEIGLAVEHLLYTVYESDIIYPAENLNELLKLVSKYKVNNFYVS